MLVEAADLWLSARAAPSEQRRQRPLASPRTGAVSDGAGQASYAVTRIKRRAQECCPWFYQHAIKPAKSWRRGFLR